MLYAGEEHWLELLAEFQIENNRDAALCGRAPTQPNAPASEASLRAAERRLGRALHPELRSLLQVANGWDEFSIASSLLGTADIAQGERWPDARQALGIFESDGAGDWLADKIGLAPQNRRYVDPLIHDPNGYTSMTYHFAGPHDAAGVFDLGDGPAKPTIYSYLSDTLIEFRDLNDWEEKGPHARPWNRDIRRDPPSIAACLAKVAELATTRLGRPDFRQYPGASPVTLDLTEATLGMPLHPLHRELLALSDGLDLPGFGHILSCGELVESTRWRALIEAAVDQESQHRAVHLPTDFRERRALLLTHTLAMPVLPFAFRDAISVHGIAIGGAAIHNVVLDHHPETGVPPRYVDVRDLLLHWAEQYWYSDQAMQRLYPES